MLGYSWKKYVFNTGINPSPTNQWPNMTFWNWRHEYIIGSFDLKLSGIYHRVIWFKIVCMLFMRSLAVKVWLLEWNNLTPAMGQWPNMTLIYIMNISRLFHCWSKYTARQWVVPFYNRHRLPYSCWKSMPKSIWYRLQYLKDILPLFDKFIWSTNTFILSRLAFYLGSADFQNCPG